jgi:tetratricopeptide (TPR) repeat protein
VTWRTGRCLPYGDGVTFWALGEIVKSHAGILDTDDRDAATAKLDAVLPADEDRSWVRARLLPLIGVTTDAGAAGGSSVSQEESFTAWRAFVESFTDGGPAVLVVEDIHWADPALLQFLEHLTSWVHGLPLLIVCTARPELFDTHPAWGAGLRNTFTLNLGPLSEPETAAVVSQLLALPVIPAATQQLILERAAGNPLWAEECVRVLRDRDLIDAQGRLRRGEVPLPHGVQALIAARLDTLPADHKALLADAAVVGRVFWADAVARLADREPDQVTGVLRELTGKEFVRPHRDSTLARHAEFGFWHGLVRDVAYQTLPRSARAAKHVAACRWLELQAGDRVADVAEILAEHTGQALDLAASAGDSALVDEVTPSARRYALLAADKALALDSARAVVLLDRALSLTPPDDLAYPDVLVRWGRAAIQVGRRREAAAAFQQAADLYQERNDLLSAGDALHQAADELFNIGDPTGRELLEVSLRLLESLEPSAEFGLALVASAINQAEAGEPEAALRTVQRVEPLLTENNVGLRGRYHMIRGMVRGRLGDADGLVEVERGVQLLVDADFVQAAAVAYYNLAAESERIEGPEATLWRLDSGETYCRARGLTGAASWLRGVRAACLAQAGRLRDALTLADGLLPDLEQAGDDLSFAEVAFLKASVLHELNGSSGRVAEEALQAARRTDIAEVLAIAVTAAATDCWTAGQPAEADALLRELANLAGISRTYWAAAVHQAVRCAVGIGSIDLAREYVAMLAATPSGLPAQQHSLLTAQAMLAHADGDYSTAVQLFTEASQRWDQFGSRLEHAHALLGLAKSLRAAGREDDATSRLQQALDLFTAMGADYRAQDCQQLLQGGIESGPRTA